MRQAKVFAKGVLTGFLKETTTGYTFIYLENYQGPPISLTMPVCEKPYEFQEFPPFFDGLLPEGTQLEGLLKLKKLDRNDYLGQLVNVGQDLVGAVTVEEDI
jgi:serine/threonine-protein kinase HipA